MSKRGGSTADGSERPGKDQQGLCTRRRAGETGCAWPCTAPGGWEGHGGDPQGLHPAARFG